MACTANTAATAAESLRFICMSPPTVVASSLPDANDSTAVATSKKTTSTEKPLVPGENIPHFDGMRKMLEQMLHKHNVCSHGAMLK
jgi:hypothetical protein